MTRSPPPPALSCDARSGGRQQVRAVVPRIADRAADPPRRDAAQRRRPQQRGRVALDLADAYQRFATLQGVNQLNVGDQTGAIDTLRRSESI